MTENTIKKDKVIEISEKEYKPIPEGILSKIAPIREDDEIYKVRVKMGRPTLYNKELGDRICKEIALGKSMRTICGTDEKPKEDMPDITTIFRWLRTDPDFYQQYESAKQESADLMIEDMLDISDDSKDLIEGDDKSDGARVQSSRLRVDTRKWIASKLKPKRYGDKLDLTSNNEKLTGSVVVYKDMSQPNDTDPNS
jgi:hypothetical protein